MMDAMGLGSFVVRFEFQNVCNIKSTSVCRSCGSKYTRKRRRLYTDEEAAGLQKFGRAVTSIGNDRDLMVFGKAAMISHIDVKVR